MENKKYSEDYIKLKNLEAEASILGEIIDNPDRALAHINSLQPKHFFDGRNRKLYHKILELDSKNKSIDMVSLSKYDILPVLELNDLQQRAISPLKVKEYESIIIENWQRRMLYKTGNKIKNQITQVEINPQDLISDVTSKFDKIQDCEAETTEIGDITPILNDLIEQRVDGVKKNPGVKTGYKLYDIKTGGLRAGDLVTIGAATSVGKTALSLNITENILFRSNQAPAIGYITLEMPPSDLLERIICTRSKINQRRLHEDRLTDKEKTRYQEVAQDINSKPLKIVQPTAKLKAVETKINILKRKYDPKIIFVDNLQNILGKDDQYREKICQATRNLKNLALNNDLTIVALSHFNRGNGDPTSRPKLSDLRESQSIEADSDKVILIHRQYKGLTLSDYREDCKLILAKNRQGQIADIPVKFNRKTARFENKEEVGF